VNVYAWLSLSASVATMLLGIIVYSLNRRKLLNKLFMLTALAGFYWTFTEFMMWQASNVEIADVWNHLGFLWPFFVVLVVHFSLAYTESKWIKNKLVNLVLYAPAVFFALIDLTTDMINGLPILKYWGYEDTSPSTFVYSLSTFWVALLPVLALLICFAFYLRADDETKRQQSKLVTLGFAIPIFTYLITNVMFPMLDIDVPNLGHFATLFFGIFVAYAILKYELFTLDAAVAAENIVSTMPDSLILADKKGKILRVNKRLVDFLGYSKDELTGEPIVVLLAEEQSFEDILNELQENRIIRNRELIFITKFGDKKNVLLSSSMVRSKTDREIVLTCVVHDITEYKEMEARLLKSEKFAAIGELATMVAHDLRNPLQGISTAVHIVRKATEKLGDEKVFSMLQHIDDSVDYSEKIVRDLLDYSADLKLYQVETNPKSIVTKALSGMIVPVNVKVVDEAQSSPRVDLDIDKIRRVIVNLVSNSFDAMPEGGTLMIASREVEGNLELSFADTGVGIPKEKMDKLWKPFFTTKAKGMGLGLPICKRIVEAHGGEILVESVEGRGTKFTLLLPIKSPERVEVEFHINEVESFNST
jgi:PAS domain S-box-containing protein